MSTIKTNNQRPHTLCTCSHSHCIPTNASKTQWSSAHNLPIIPVTFEGLQIQALLDSGSQIPLIADHVYQQIKETINAFREEKLQAFSCNGGELDIPGIVTGNLSLHQHDSPITAEFYILKQSTQDCIIPHTWLSKLNAKLDWQSQTLSYELPQENCVLKANGDLEIPTEIPPSPQTQPLNIKQSVQISPNTQTTLVVPSSPTLPSIFKIGVCHGFLRSNKTGNRQILTLFNSTPEPVTISQNCTVEPYPKPTSKTVPTRIKPRLVQAITSDASYDQELKERDIIQSQYDHSSKSLLNLPIPQHNISFTLPTPLQTYPFDKDSDPLTILYVYVVYLVGTNLQYHLKTPEELCLLVEQIGNRKHKQILHSIRKQFDKAQIQRMYIQTALHVIFRIHQCFLEYQQKHNTAQRSLRKVHYKRESVRLYRQMVLEIKTLVALYFLIQALIHTFYCNTLQHPYFRKLEFPSSLQEILKKLQTPAQTNAVQIPMPSRILSQQALHNTFLQNTEAYQPQELNFDQYKIAVHNTCQSYSQQYHEQLNTHTSPCDLQPEAISDIETSKLQQFIAYSKSPKRLADFLSEQIPAAIRNPEPKETVTEILDNMPLPKWIYYSTETEIINDYIPPCLKAQFEEFFIHFSDPVFIKLSGMHALPYPPTEALLESDPPDSLHIDNGLVDPKVLAATACQFLTHDHVILQPSYKRELTLLACVLFIFGQTGLSLHALDTGKFKQAFEVKTILASTAPTSSHPSRQSTETVNPDLDERLEFLAKQGKVTEILGSPYLAQLSSVPKNYKTSKVFTSEKLDPVLRYISELPHQTKHLLAQQSQELGKKQQQLIQQLSTDSPEVTVMDTHTTEQPQTKPLNNPLTVHHIRTTQEATQPNALFFEDNILQLTIVDLKTKQELFLSDTPPSDRDKIQFSKRINKHSTQPLRHSKVKFTYAFILTTEDPAELREYRQRVQYSKHHREYFYTTQDFDTHNIREFCQSVAQNSKSLLKDGTHSQLYTEYQNNKQVKQPINFITNHFPNVGQLAKNKLQLNIAHHQNYLAACNNIHFAINQFSSQAPLNRFVDEDNPKYNMMRRLALSPEYLAESHAQNPTNTAPQQLIQHCMHITNISTLSHNKLKYQYVEKHLAKIHIKSHNTQNFTKLISLLNTSMRQLDHKRALKTTHSLKQNTIEILTKLHPHLQEQWDKLSLQDILKYYSGWPQMIGAISEHYQVPILWLEVEVIQTKHFFQNPNIKSINIENSHLYTHHQPAFAVLAFDTTSLEFYGVRPVTNSIKLLLNAAHKQTLGTKFTLADALQCIKPRQGAPNQASQSSTDQSEKEQHNKPSTETHSTGGELLRPRFTKTPYPHIKKEFYQKNAITRFILNSRDTNKLTRPTNTHMQSQSSIINNLGSSEMFSNYDLTSAFDAVPACPISSLINTASYRRKEFSLLIASMGGSNSVLFCQRAVTSLMHRINDQLLLRPCYKPHPIKGLNPALERTIEEGHTSPTHLTPKIPIAASWNGSPLLNLSAPRLIKQIQYNLMYGDRDVSQHHYIPMSPDARQQVLNQKTTDTLLSTSALIDDVVCSSKQINSTEYLALPGVEQTRIHLQIHIQVLIALFQAINALSQDPGIGPDKFGATLKLKLEKSCFATTSIRYLNLIYIKGYQVINTDNFKKSCKYLDTLPSNGDELRSALGFTNYLLSFTKSLRYLVKNLETLATKHPAKKAIQWDQYPTLKQEYQLLCQTIKASNCLHTLPPDLNQLDMVVFNTDACSVSLSYCVAFSTKPLPSDFSKNTPLKLLKYHSAKLPDHCLNLTILLKETISGVLCLIQEGMLLKLIPPSCRKFLIIDSKPLFDLLSKYLSNGQLNALFTAHPTIQLWIERLYQFLITHNITLLLVPTKLNAPADFLTRKVHNVVACQGTQKKVACSLCPGCQHHCIRKSAHSNCPYTIGSGPNQPPRLIPFNTITSHTVKIDNDDVTFQSTETAFNPSDYIEFDLAKPLQVLGTSFAPSASLEEVRDLYEEPIEITTMLENNQEQLAVLDNTISALHSIQAQPKPPTSSHVTKTLTTALKQRVMPNNIYIYTDYMARTLHSLVLPPHTTVIHFTTQKKSWNKTNEYFSRILAETAIARIDFNVGQVEMVHFNNTLFVVLCADTSPTPPHLTPDTLFPNIHACLKKLPSLAHPPHTVIFDFESIRKLHQIPPATLVHALNLISADNSCARYQYEIYVYNPPLPTHLPSHQLQITIPVIHNQIRKGIVSTAIELTDSLSTVQDKILVQLEQLVPTTNLRSSKLGLIHKNTVHPLQPGCPITGAQLILVKDHTYQPPPQGNCYVFYAQHNNKPLIVFKADLSTKLIWVKAASAHDWAILDTSSTIQQELLNTTQRQFTAFQLSLDKPLATKFYPWVIQYNDYVSPKLSTQIPLACFTNLLLEHPTLKQLRFYTTTSVNNIFLTPDADATQTPKHVLQHLLGTHTSILLAQAADPTVQELALKTKQSQGPLIIQQYAFDIFDNILFGRHLSPTQNVTTTSSYRPVISQSQLIPEILQTHKKLRCAPPQKVFHDIITRYFHQKGITSDTALETLIKDFIPCHICILGRAAHVTAPLYLKTQSIGLESLGIQNCNLISNDVFYLSKGPNPHFKEPYLSVIVCNSCRFISLQPISEITSTNLASHILEFCQLSGKIPHVIISDAASTQTGSEMKKLLSDFFLIHVTANRRILNKPRELPHPPNNTTNAQQHQTLIEDGQTGLPLDQLTEPQKQLLLQDVQKSSPSLYNTILTHHPASYKANQTNRETSLGSLDHVCKRLKIFLQKFILDVPPDSNVKDHVENLIKSFVYLNNFKTKAAFTKQIPAVLHLGLLRHNTMLSMMNNITALTTPTSRAITTMQQILNYANNFRQAEISAYDFQSKQQDRQLKQHGRLLNEDNLLQNLTPFTVIFTKAELDPVPKLHTFTQFIGPYVVVSINPHSKTLYLYSLLSSDIHKTSYRHVRQAFNTHTIFSTPIFGQLGDALQFNFAEKFSHLHKQPSREQTASDIQKILINLHKLLMFVAPILPTTIQTQEALTLTLDDPDVDPNPINQDSTLNTDYFEDTTEQPPHPNTTQSEESSTQKKVKFSFHEDNPDLMATDIIHKPNPSKQVSLESTSHLPTHPVDLPNVEPGDNQLTTRSDQRDASTSQDSTPRPLKYSLRQNPRKNPTYS